MTSHAREKKHGRGRERTRLEFYLLVAFAVCVLALAFYMGVMFTQNRLTNAGQDDRVALKGIIEEIQHRVEPSIDPEQLSSQDYWPGDLFPSVPQFQASSYSTRVDGMRAVIGIPASDAGMLGDYIKGLSESGASIHVRAETLIVLVQAGTEIQIAPTGSRPTITLCGEPQMNWQNNIDPALILPKAGKLVAAVSGLSPDGMDFTYRNASIRDVMEYVNDLARAGWSNDGKLNFRNNTLLAQYRKGERSITVDYFANGDNYVIHYEKSAPSQDSGA